MKTRKFLGQYLLYLGRWQLSSFILAPVIWICNVWAISSIWAAVIGNFIGGLIFYWIDKYLIFRNKRRTLPLWEIKRESACSDCGKVDTCYRIVEWGKYNRHDDPNPEYRCQECSLKKMESISA